MISILLPIHWFAFIITKKKLVCLKLKIYNILEKQDNNK